MDDKGKVLPVQDPVEFLEGGVERDLLEGGVGGLGDGVGRLDLALEQLALQAAEGGHPLDGAGRVDHRQLVEALAVHDLNGLLYGNIWKDGGMVTIEF